MNRVKVGIEKSRDILELCTELLLKHTDPPSKTSGLRELLDVNSATMFAFEDKIEGRNIKVHSEHLRIRPIGHAEEKDARVLIVLVDNQRVYLALLSAEPDLPAEIHSLCKSMRQKISGDEGEEYSFFIQEYFSGNKYGFAWERCLSRLLNEAGGGRKCPEKKKNEGKTFSVLEQELAHRFHFQLA